MAEKDDASSEKRRQQMEAYARKKRREGYPRLPTVEEQETEISCYKMRGGVVGPNWEEFPLVLDLLISCGAGEHTAFADLYREAVKVVLVEEGYAKAA